VNKDNHLIFEAYKENTLKDADGVEIVDPNMRKFVDNFHLDEYLQRILYNYKKYQNPSEHGTDYRGDLNKFIKAVDSIWIGTHPRALKNLHHELLEIRGEGNRERKFMDQGYYPKEENFYAYLKDWLQREAMGKIWQKLVPRTLTMPR
jgi:hypothetical protein